MFLVVLSLVLLFKGACVVFIDSTGSHVSFPGIVSLARGLEENTTLLLLDISCEFCSFVCLQVWFLTEV
jgi:hypothetical protein